MKIEDFGGITAFSQGAFYNLKNLTIEQKYDFTIILVVNYMYVKNTK